MRYLTPDFIDAYESADKDGRKKMLRTILDAWDSEYQSLIGCGVSPDTIWVIGIGQVGEITGTDETDDHR